MPLRWPRQVGGALRPPPSRPSPSLSTAYLTSLVNELAGLFKVNVSLSTTPSSKRCGVNWVLAQGWLLTRPFLFRFSFPVSLEPWLLVMVAEPVSVLPAHRMTAGTHFLCLVPPAGSVALASDGDRPKPLALCSGSHFHFVSLLSPAKSTTFGLTSSSKSSMPALGHNELSFL